jgi:hypothetical protein
MMNIQTVHITLRNPHDDADPGECAIINYVVDGNVVKVTDKDGALLRLAKGEPCKQVLEPGDDPRQIAARLGRSYHNQMYGDRERGFWRDLPRPKDVPV